MLDKTPEDKPKDDFFDNIAIDIFLFAAPIISILTIVAIIHLVCRHSKLKALLTGVAFQPVNQAEAAVTKQANEFCTAQWYVIAALTVLTILLIVYICVSNQKCAMFKRRLYSNTVTIMLFFSDIKQYVPVKLCKTAGSIHLFQIYGQLDPKPNNSRKELSMGHDKDRLERSLCDFEWHNIENAKNSQNST